MVDNPITLFSTNMCRKSKQKWGHIHCPILAFNFILFNLSFRLSCGSLWIPL